MTVADGLHVNSFPGKVSRFGSFTVLFKNHNFVVGMDFKILFRKLFLVD